MLGPISIVGRTGLIAGPALFVTAALVSLFDIDRATDRWYDSWLEGSILLLGAALFAAGLLYAAGVVSERDRLGIILGFTGVIGAVGMAGLRLFVSSALSSSSWVCPSKLSIRHSEMVLPPKGR